MKNSNGAKQGDYVVIHINNDLYSIVGCEAGSLYGDSIIVSIFDLNGNEGYYLYVPDKKLYRKVDINLPEFKKYPCRYFGSKKHEIERRRAYGFSTILKDMGAGFRVFSFSR